MRIGVIAYLLHGGTGYRAAGVSTYAQSLIEALASALPRDDLVVFHGADAPALHGARSVHSALPTYRAPVRILWEQIALPAQAALARVQLIHGLVNVVPLATALPRVVTVHDLAFLRYPERFRRGRALYLRRAVSASVRRSRVAIAISESTRQDLIELLRVPESRVTVVYPAADRRFMPLSSEEVGMFRETQLGGRPIILYVGTLEPRKNVDLLLRAFARARRALDLPHQLVLVGGRGWMYEEIFRIADDLHLGDAVRFEGYVARDELPLWYNAADLFAYPSAYEGFGLPVLEAMACGVPVLTTSSSSLSEIAGSACLTVEPNSQEALEVGLQDLLGSGEMRERLSRAGMERAAQFSWSQTSADTVGVYRQVLEA